MVTKNQYEAALQTVLVELLKAVVSQTKRTAKFRTLLRRLDKTLRSLEPIMCGHGRLARVLDRPEKETKMFIYYVENGKEIVLKCSRIMCWNVYKKFVHANKLIRLDHELLRFFQVELQDNLSTRFRGLSLGGEVDQVPSSITKQAGGFSSSSNIPELPGVIIGFDFHLKVVKRILLKDDIQVLTVTAPGGCGKTTLAKMLCHDAEIKDVFGDNIFFVTVSRTTSFKTIVQKLLTHHLQVNNCELQTYDEAKNELENMMRKMGSEKILLVLDDVWSESELLIQDLKYQIPGYTILVTSRFMFSRIGSTYELGLLNDEDAKALLIHSAFPCDRSQANMPADLVSKVSFKLSKIIYHTTSVPHMIIYS
ncbi:putative disease resistance protein At5g66900 [Bidens hawaiensis]|uniref:putative disease resistance protein At5g66900 n=1 Tax=Bidens hawaiensis TaxID=980011 RepID=UPI00404A7A49